MTAIRLSIKWFHSWDIPDIEPLMERDVSAEVLPDKFRLEFAIGPASGPAADDFACTVELTAQKTSRATDKVLHVPNGNLKDVRRRIEQLVQASERGSWAASAKVLSTHFDWEYGELKGGMR